MLPPTFSPAFLRRLELYRLRARRAFLGMRQGGHLSLKKGHGIEFADYRKYEMGDSPRHIDWGVFARTERLYVKRFQEEQDLRLLIVCDGSASMTAGTKVKWEAARDISLALSYIALLEQDSVMISVPPSTRTPWVSGARAIHFCAEALSKAEPTLGVARDPEAFIEGVKRAAAQVRLPGIAVVISDFLFEFPHIETLFNALRARNLDLTALRIAGPLDETPLAVGESATVIDSETGARVALTMTPDVAEEYRARLAAHRAQLAGFFGKSGIRYSEFSVPPASSDFIVEAVATSGVVR